MWTINFSEIVDYVENWALGANEEGESNSVSAGGLLANAPYELIPYSGIRYGATAINDLAFVLGHHSSDGDLTARDYFEITGGVLGGIVGGVVGAPLGGVTGFMLGAAGGSGGEALGGQIYDALTGEPVSAGITYYDPFGVFGPAMSTHSPVSVDENGNRIGYSTYDNANGINVHYEHDPRGYGTNWGYNAPNAHNSDYVTDPFIKRLAA
jgi:hypothetical protein